MGHYSEQYGAWNDERQERHEETIRRAVAMDRQEGGTHYKNAKIQPVEYIHANGIDFLSGNIIKYATRHKDKNGAEDIRKIIHYAELILQLEYGEGR